jgi:hypothetical protein
MAAEVLILMKLGLFVGCYAISEIILCPVTQPSGRYRMLKLVVCRSFLLGSSISKYRKMYLQN